MLFSGTNEGTNNGTHKRQKQGNLATALIKTYWYGLLLCSRCGHSFIQETPLKRSFQHSIIAIWGNFAFAITVSATLLIYLRCFFHSVASIWPAPNPFSNLSTHSLALKLELIDAVLYIMVRSSILFAALASVASVYAQGTACNGNSKCPVDKPCCSRTSNVLLYRWILLIACRIWRMRCGSILLGRLRPSILQFPRFLCPGARL